MLKMNRKLIISVLAAVSAVACLKNEVEIPASGGMTALKIEASSAESAWTRSGINGDGEDALVCAAIGIYDAKGRLVHSDRAEGPFSGFSSPVSLHSDRPYRCYMVTGYIASVIEYPDSESDLPSIVIDNTSSTDSSTGEYSLAETLENYGLDRAGSTALLTPSALDAADGAEDGIITVPLRSLWAKVMVALDFSEVRGISLATEANQVRNHICGPLYGSRLFAPFSQEGNSTRDGGLALLPRAGRVDDDSYGDGLIRFVFYVPENMLGYLLPGNNDPDLKTPSSVAAQHGGALGDVVEKSSVVLNNPVLTEWGQQTEMTYRFCLGNNACSNFDVRRGAFYKITLKGTANGYRIKQWKSEYDVQDSRSIEIRSFKAWVVRSVSSGIVAFNTEFEKYDSAQASPGDTVYLDVLYKLGTSNRSWAGYGDYWSLSDECKSNLSSLGIKYTVLGRFVYAVNGSNEITYNSSNNGSFSNPGKKLVYLDSKTLKSAIVRLILPPTLDAGMSFPVTVETFDALHAASTTVQTPSSGSVSVRWKRKPSYIAQKGLLQGGDFSGDVADVVFSVKAGSEDIIEVVDNGDNTCSVSLIGAGTGYVRYKGRNSKGVTVCQGDMPVSSTAPVLVPTKDCYSLSPDGKEEYFTCIYTGTAGNVITRADTEEKGYGGCFSPSLYDRLLKSTASAGESIMRGFLGFGNGTIFVSKLSSGGSFFADLLGRTVENAIVFRASGSADIEPVSADAVIVNPIGNSSGADVICSIDNHTLSGGTVRRTLSSLPVRTGADVVLSPDAITINGTPSSYSMEDLPDMSFEITGEAGIRIRGKSSPASYTAGRTTLYLSCHNSHSGETLRMAAGTVDVYLHIAAEGIIDLSPLYPEVSVDIRGYGLHPAAAYVRDRLFNAGPGCVHSTFSQGGYYYLGDGRWNYTDEFDDAGNQYTSPLQSDRMTEFRETDRLNPVGLGTAVYKILPGILESEAGVYDSEAAFKAAVTKPAAELIFPASLDCLMVSPFNSRLYHLEYGDEGTDDEGYPYYIVDRDIPGWRD